MAKKALIVEDVAANRYMLTFLLKANGWEVAEAETPEQALAAAATYLPDVILLDVGLGNNVSGYSLVAPIRAMPKLEDVPIIAVTSYAMSKDR
jgi:two-component system, cell cycle response regulator DivK